MSKRLRKLDNKMEKEINQLQAKLRDLSLFGLFVYGELAEVRQNITQKDYQNHIENLMWVEKDSKYGSKNPEIGT